MQDIFDTIHIQVLENVRVAESDLGMDALDHIIH
jgi:hypothetical protein